MARRAIPTEVKRANGNPGKQPLPPQGTEPPIVAPPLPDGLSGAAEAVWRWISAKLVEYRLLSDLDGASLAIYCQAVVDWAEANDDLKRRGKRLAASNGAEYLNPSWKIKGQCETMILRLSKAFGLDPSSRASIFQDPAQIAKMALGGGVGNRGAELKKGQPDFESEE